MLRWFNVNVPATTDWSNKWIQKQCQDVGHSQIDLTHHLAALSMAFKNDNMVFWTVVKVRQMIKSAT